MSEGRVPLPPITRPDGRLYRPRKIAVQLMGDDGIEEVVVFGTEDRELAQSLAERDVAVYVDSRCTAAFDYAAWLRLGYQNGEPWWSHDEVRGRFGLVFAVVERTEPTSEPAGGLS